MQNQFSRTELIYGDKAMDKLKRSRVAVFGIGGVGGYAVEALARSGIGAIDLIDDDKFCISNINRQIYACLLYTSKTLQKKVKMNVPMFFRLCIRIYSHWKSMFLTRKILNRYFYVNMLILWEMAVSYTHLDVYKRQIYNS